MIDIDKLEALAMAAADHGENIGEESWYEKAEFVSNMLMHPIDANFAEACTPAAILGLVAEVRRLSGIVAKVADPSQVLLTGMNPVGGALNIGLEGGACKLLAESFADQFRESDSVNYLELTFTADDVEIGELLVTLQRKNGKTPAQLRRDAEAERDTFRADANRYIWLKEHIAHFEWPREPNVIDRPMLDSIIDEEIAATERGAK